MQLEIKAIHNKFGLTTISVTHDQEEALTMATKVCVMKEAKIQQLSLIHISPLQGKAGTRQKGKSKSWRVRSGPDAVSYTHLDVYKRQEENLDGR